MSALTDPVQPKKSLGQHWLDDQPSLRAMLDSAAVGPADTVLEVGPGLGALTELLVERAKHVVAVEVDPKLAASLPKRIKSDNLEIVSQNILNFDLSGLPKGYKLVANIPYYLTGNLIRAISESSNPPQKVALLVQKEVAERVVAKPGEMSVLGVTAQFYWQVELGRIVPARLFTPPPKVDSQILILKRLSKPLFTGLDKKDFFRLVKAGFSQRRKTLLNSLSAGLQLGRDDVASHLERASINPERRAQSLSLQEWHQLYKAIFN